MEMSTTNAMEMSTTGELTGSSVLLEWVGSMALSRCSHFCLTWRCLMHVVDQVLKAWSEGPTSGSIPVGNPGLGTWAMAWAPQSLQRWEMATTEPKVMRSGESTAVPGSLHVPQVWSPRSPLPRVPLSCMAYPMRQK